MANKTVTVKASAGDYTTLAGAIAGELIANADLTAGGMNGILTIECYTLAGADSTAVNVSGFTTDATHYIRIVVPAAERHDGKRNTGKYRLEVSASGGSALAINDDYVRVEGLQIRNTHATGAYAASVGAGTSATSDVRFIDCIAYDSPGSDGFSNQIGGTTFLNCIAFGNGKTGFNSKGSAGVTQYAYNCAAVNNTQRGFFAGSFRTFVVKNCYAGGNTGNDYETETNGVMTSTTCHDEDGTGDTTTAFATGSGGYFTNVTGGSEDLHIGSASSALIGAATDLHADAKWTHPGGAVDIDGNARPDGAWDVGVDEYNAAVAPTLSSPTISAAGALTATLSQSGCLPASGSGGFALAGTTATVTAWSISGTTLTLTTSKRLCYGETVTVAYDRGNTTDDITESTGVEYLATFTAVSVTNNSAVPLAPSDLAVTSTTATAIGLNWSDNATNETGYDVQYDTVATFDASPTTIEIAAADTETSTIIDLVVDTTYYIRVRATVATQDSDWAYDTGPTNQYVSTTTYIDPPTLTATASVQTVTLTWADPAGVDKYEVQASEDGNTWEVVADDLDIPSDESYTVNSGNSPFTLTPGATVYFRLRFYDPDPSPVTLGYSTVAETTLLEELVAPTLSFVTKTGTSISVSWTDASDGDPGLNGYAYFLYYSDEIGSPTKYSLEDITSPETITGLTTGTTYYIFVQARDFIDSQANSNSITIKLSITDVEKINSTLAYNNIKSTIFTERSLIGTADQPKPNNAKNLRNSKITSYDANKIATLTNQNTVLELDHSLLNKNISYNNGAANTKEIS